MIESVKILMLASVVIISALVINTLKSHNEQAELNDKNYNCDALENYIVQAKCYMRIGRLHKMDYEFIEAIDRYKQGLYVIRDYNIYANHIDDTGLQLALADKEILQGKMSIAADLYRRVLNSRISMAESNEN